MDRIVVLNGESIPELSLRNADSCISDLQNDPAGCPSDVSCGDDC